MLGTAALIGTNLIGTKFETSGGTLVQKIAIVALFVAIAISPVQPACAQDKHDLFSEGIVFAGTSLVSNGSPNVGAGAGYLAGWGNHQAVSVEFSYNDLHDYAVGYGKAFGPPYLTSPVSHSRQYDFSFGYQFELLSREHNHSRFAPYLTAGGGYVHSAFVTTPNNSTGAYPLPQAATFYNRGWAPFVGAGIRIPLYRGMGIRAEMREWIVPSFALFNANEPYGDQSAPSGSLTRLSLGIFYRK